MINQAKSSITKPQLQAFCRSLGIEYVGIAPPGPYEQLGQLLEQRRRQGFYTEFEEPDIQKRITPSLEGAEVGSILVALFPYYPGEVPTANLAKYTYGLDYHLVVQEKLQQIGQFLKEHIPKLIYKAYVDNGPLVDRYVAYLAGLGFYGRNHQFINEKYGSYVFIGYIVTDYPFVPDFPQERFCLDCGQCIKACPGQALTAEGLQPSLCCSYITQKKGELSEAEQRLVKGSRLVFGCDCCQEACPHNQNVPITPLVEFRELLQPYLDYEELNTLSNKEFSSRYKQRAFSWRGKKPLLRNLEILRTD